MEMGISHNNGNGNGKDCELSDGNVTEMGTCHNNGNENEKPCESDKPIPVISTHTYRATVVNNNHLL